jgi:biofilm PGA synthesis lipoprotein PgaB
MLLGGLTGAVSAYAAENDFIVLNYHDIEDMPGEEGISSAVTLSSRELARHFDWLKAHNYHIVSLSDVLDAHAGRKTLPDKAVLLTFDDGYLSTYTRVFPLLKLYHYPAVIGLVTSWMQTPVGQQIRYGSTRIERRRLLSWKQVNEMISSGLVEIASHSHALHHGQLSSPQGSRLPAATNRLYNPKNASYESDADYRARIRADLAESMAIITRHTGRPPRAIIWPYGSYNAESIAIAEELGMPVTFSLDDGVNNAASVASLKRLYIASNMSLEEIVRQMHGRYWRQPQRAVHVDLDLLYDPNPKQQDRNLGLLVDRLARLHINTVYLQAFADPDGDGAADALYFPNRHMPVRSDFFGQAAETLHSRLGVKVYAWMPVLAFAVDDERPQRVSALEHGDDETAYRRLSPFDDEARRLITDIYEDLGKYTRFDGLLFHDDAVLSDYEDTSPAATAVYSGNWDLPASVSAIRAAPTTFRRWTRLKTTWLDDFTDSLTAAVRHYRPRIKTARNIYASVVMEPDSETWLAQSFADSLEHYDTVALMAMPYLENAADPDAWLRRLIERVGAYPGALDKTLFELQTVDWRNDGVIDGRTLRRQMKLLQLNGAVNFGYYPDNFVEPRPRIPAIFPAMSLQSFPYPKPGTGQH